MDVSVQVAEVYTDHATIESKGKQISRDATEDNPAFYVERHGQGSGNPVLKKRTELHKLERDENVNVLLILLAFECSYCFVLEEIVGCFDYVRNSVVNLNPIWLVPGPDFRESGD